MKVCKQIHANMSLYWITFSLLTLMDLIFRKVKVNVVLVVKKTSRAFELNFQTDGMVWVPCDRCLDDMEQLFQFDR